MPSTTITSLLWPAGSSVAVTGEVFEAQPTKTRYMLRGCKDIGCDYQTAFVNLGPWASETLPRGAAETGIYDVHGTINGTMYSSVCEMSRSVIEKCTVSMESGIGDSTEYTITKTKGIDFTLSYHAVTLTRGFEKFSSVSDATPASKGSSTDEASSTTEPSTATKTSIDSATSEPGSSAVTDTPNKAATTTESSGSAAPTETDSAGSRPLVRAFVALTFAGIATALVI